AHRMSAARRLRHRCGRARYYVDVPVGAVVSWRASAISSGFA
ncbi:hypothetical protein B1M_13095, partial [Burkholderia sp. TJI49]